MNVVVNATPLIALSLIGRLDLLPQLFDEVLVPQTVYDEVVTHGAGRAGTTTVARAPWIVVVAPTTRPALDPLLLGLDAGEMDVLLLAREVKPDWVLIDERLARRVAKALKLPVKGTVGLLLAAVMVDLMSKTEALDALTMMTANGIRVGPRWQAWLRDELEKIA